MQNTAPSLPLSKPTLPVRYVPPNLCLAAFPQGYTHSRLSSLLLVFSFLPPTCSICQTILSFSTHAQCQRPLSRSSMVSAILGATVPGAEAFLTFSYRCSTHPSHGSLPLAPAKAGKPGGVKSVCTGLVN